jgi:phytoene dehydrogenase-like protein
MLGGRKDPWRSVAVPMLPLVRHRTPLGAVYLCSSATPPDGGVHGLCGALAAQVPLSRFAPAPGGPVRAEV